MKYSMGKASWCFITEEHVVKSYSARNKKSVKPARGSLYDCWLRETTCLERLTNSIHFPHMIAHNVDDSSLVMTNKGDSLFNTWHEHDLKKYVEQAHYIADELSAQKIFYFYPGMDPRTKDKSFYKFPLSNYCIQDGELSLIDFELSLPKDSLAEARISDRLDWLYQHYNQDHFREALVLALEEPRISWESELHAKLVDKDKFDELRTRNPREVWDSMTMFTQPPEKVIKEWKNYQRRYGLNDAESRVERMGLVDLANSMREERTLIDIGCNDGFITKLMANHVKKAVGVEPFVKLSDDKKPANVKWYRGTFNDYLKYKKGKFDIVLSLAVSIQLRDFGGLSEQEIVDGYHKICRNGGIVVHETQKLENRPNNQEHTEMMLTAFREKFEEIEHGQARPSGNREYYHFRKK